MTDINTIPVSAPAAKINSQTNNRLEKISSPAIEIENDTINLSKNDKLTKEEKGLIPNIKKGIRDGVVMGALVYTGSSIINYFKEKISSKNLTAEQKAMCAKLPAKSLGIAIGAISTITSVWTMQTSEQLEKLSAFTRKWTGLGRHN